MPMTATMAPYTLFILDDDTPMNPREDHDCLGKMVFWHSRYSLGEKHDYDEPSDFLRSLLFYECKITVSLPVAFGMEPLTVIWKAIRRSSDWCLQWTMTIWPVTRMGNCEIGGSLQRQNG